MITVDISGLDELDRQLQAIGEDIALNVIRDAGKAAMAPVAQDMKRNAGYDPSNTGEHMRDSITIRSRSRIKDGIAGTLDCRVIGERRAIAGSYAIMPMVTAEAYFNNMGLDSVIGDPTDEASQVEFGTSAHIEGGITVLTNGLAKSGDPNSWGHVSIKGGRYTWFELLFGPEGKNTINTPIPYINAAEYI